MIHTPSRFDGLQTYSGSCRCGAVRFEADIDLTKGTSRCNCTSCTKNGWWGCIVPPASFRLVAGAGSLVSFGKTAIAEHPRCTHCGVEAFGHGDVPQIGGEYYSVNVRCLDGVDLAGVPVRYLDGKSDTWALLAVRPYTDPFVTDP